MRSACDLSIVMPVYNEELGIDAVVDSWVASLDRLHLRYELLLYDDGSKDGTGSRLDAIALRHPAVRVTHQRNQGHGPTVLRGYHEAQGEWVFQTDSDDEIPASAFEPLWRARQDADAVFGIRTGRPSGPARRLLTAGASWCVRLLFGRGPTDVNVPFRLIRRAVLERLLPRIPPETFAPNVVLSGLVARDRVRFVEVPVPAVARRLGETTIVGIKTLKLGTRAARETVAAALADRRRGRSR
ncbi:MAG: glycosyltransferase family 2 protein [Acidobacteria bacterium]|nr:glycosyltransferase family 2 protein [Acidobacteriota bacterium]